MATEQRRHYQTQETHELLRLGTTELTDGARIDLLAELMDRGVDAAQFQSASDAASDTRSQVERSVEPRKSARRAPANRYLAAVASASVAGFSAIVLFAMLTSNSHSALRLASVGDTDAAMLKTSAMALFLAAAALILGLVNRRLAFYSLLGTCAMLFWVALEPSHHLLAALFPTAICVGIECFLFARKYHVAPLGQWLAWTLSIVFMPLTALMVFSNWRGVEAVASFWPLAVRTWV